MDGARGLKNRLGWRAVEMKLEVKNSNYSSNKGF